MFTVIRDAYAGEVRLQLVPSRAGSRVHEPVCPDFGWMRYNALLRMQRHGYAMVLAFWWHSHNIVACFELNLVGRPRLATVGYRFAKMSALSPATGQLLSRPFPYSLRAPPVSSRKACLHLNPQPALKPFNSSWITRSQPWKLHLINALLQRPWSACIIKTHIEAH